MKLNLKNKNLIILLYVILSCVACNKHDTELIETWEHISDNDYIEFVETNNPGIVGGALMIELLKNQTFTEAVTDHIIIDNFPDSLTPFFILNDSKNTLKVTISGKATKHAKVDSHHNISIHIPAEYITGEEQTGITIQNIKILFHDVGCIWKSPVTSKEYYLVFNDEFNEGEIDPKRWIYRASTQKITRRIEYNSENYDIVVENEASVLKDGNMQLKVYKKEDSPRKIFTGGILTLDKFMPRYGYFETYVSFKDCGGFGHWPAFGLHFVNTDKNTTGTEIDIFEYINKSQNIFQTLHWYINDEHLSSSENLVLDNRNEFHKFGLEWTPDELIFYMNDKVTRHLKNSENDRFVPDAYQMVYYSMSAGTWGGNVADPSNNLPAISKFDYCRIYQAKDRMHSINLAMGINCLEQKAGWENIEPLCKLKDYHSN